MDIKIVVTPERFDEIFSLEDWLNFDSMTVKEAYEYMLQFVVGEDGKPVGIEAARRLFKSVKKKDWPKYIEQFASSVRDAFVNPTKGSGSSSLSKAGEQRPLPDGSQS